MIDWLTDELIALKREAIESIYDHVMNVYTTKLVYNPETGFDEQQEILTIENEPCRISTQVTDPTDDLPPTYREKSNLICAPELDIPEGSRIEVDFYCDKHVSYVSSSAPRHYSDHQTILMLRQEEGRADYA